MTNWTPETNRIQTMHLTADELAALKATKWGWEMHTSAGSGWMTVEYPIYAERIYRAKPAHVTHDVVPWEATRENVMALIDEYLAEVKRLQQRPVTVGVVTEPLAFNTRYWVSDGSCSYGVWNNHPVDYRRLRDGVIYLTEADAIAAAKTMCAKGGV